MKIKDISVFDRPRERLLRSEVLSDAELLAVILQTGSGKDNAVDLTQRVISRFGTSLVNVGFNELMSVPGIGVDRFIMGKVGTGILKLITLGGFGVWWLIDLILIATKYHFKNVVWVE